MEELKSDKIDYTTKETAPTIRWDLLERHTKKMIDLALKISKDYEKKINPELILQMMIQLLKT